MKLHRIERLPGQPELLNNFICTTFVASETLISPDLNGHLLIYIVVTLVLFFIPCGLNTRVLIDNEVHGWWTPLVACGVGFSQLAAPPYGGSAQVLQFLVLSKGRGFQVFKCSYM